MSFRYDMHISVLCKGSIVTSVLGVSQGGRLRASGLASASLAITRVLTLYMFPSRGRLAGEISECGHHVPPVTPPGPIRLLLPLPLQPAPVLLLLSVCLAHKCSDARQAPLDNEHICHVVTCLLYFIITGCVIKAPLLVVLLGPLVKKTICGEG
jgi:hypothetical protein